MKQLFPPEIIEYTAECYFISIAEVKDRMSVQSMDARKMR